MPDSQPATTHAPSRVQRESTSAPAATSTMPTKRMNARPLTGDLRSKSRARYFSQSTSRLVNLSAPATMGRTPYPIRSVSRALSAMVRLLPTQFDGALGDVHLLRIGSPDAAHSPHHPGSADHRRRLLGPLAV